MAKKRINGAWADNPHYIMGTATDTLTLPAVIYPNDTLITVGIKGQSSQSGTPSPSNPVDVNGTGERTGNLFDGEVTATDKRISINNGGTYSSTSTVGYSVSDYIPIKASTSYIINKNYESSSFYALYDNSKTFIAGGGMKTGSPTSSNYTNAAYIRFDFLTSDISTIVFVEGSTAPSEYIPYGYKIPISSANTTTPVYLGEVETTRRVKKLVLTGEENITYTVQSGINRFSYANSSIVSDNNRIGYCSHYKYDFANVNHNCYIATSGGFLYFFDNDISDETAFKSYLAAQYANGTPVTVWYVLATEETGVVNEPLMKIGDYSDSLTTSIPCTAGENTLDVQTTVQPSEVTAGFSGWHPITEVHERENGQWD